MTEQTDRALLAVCAIFMGGSSSSMLINGLNWVDGITFAVAGVLTVSGVISTYNDR